MKNFSLVLALLLVGGLLAENTDYIFPCYYVYEPQLLAPESIPVFNLCTHIILIGCTGEVTNSTSVQVHTRPLNCSTALRKVSDLKRQNPALKVMFSTGINADAMHLIVQTEESMNQYADSVINLAVEYNYDGIDFDWEYPCGADKMKFTRLLEIVRGKVSEGKSRVLLSAAIGAGINTLKECFDLDGLSNNLDFINVMCYDYNTIYNTKTAYASPLFARPEETGYDATLNSNYTINYLISNNVPRNKIVLGLNAGGHTFQLAEPSTNYGFHAPVLGVGYTGGWSLYPQLCQIMRNGQGVYDEVAQVLYAHFEDQWTNTGDVRSARAKALWARELGLAGVFTFCLNWDDIYNVCGHNVTFPIHRAIRKELFPST